MPLNSKIANQTIQFFAIHLPNEYPRMGFKTKEEAQAFIKGLAFACGCRRNKNNPCDGVLAEWDIIRHNF